MHVKKDERIIPLSDIVPEYHSSCFLVKKIFYDRIKYAIKLGSTRGRLRILDIGCGSGTLLRELRRNNTKSHLVGLDININTKELVNEGFKIYVCDINKNPFKDNFFDIVYALDSLEHIKEIDYALTEIKRILKPNKPLIISGPTESLFYKLGRFIIKGTFSEKVGPGTGIHYYNIYQLDRLIRKKFRKVQTIKLPRFFTLEIITKYINKK